MVSLPRPDVILTHESDLDGFLSGLLCRKLARHLFGADVPLLSYHNHNWKQRPLVEKAAWVCDFAFESRLDRPNWLVIDHHPPESTPQRADLVHAMDQSAAALCYRLCCERELRSDKLDRLVHLSDVADLFLDDDPDFALAQDYANLVKTYQFWNLEALLEGDPERLLDHPLLEVMAVKRRVEDPIGLAWNRNHITEITPRVGLVHTLIGNTNLIIHTLFEQQAIPYPVLITLFRRGNGTFLVSLRSRNGEALQVAAKLQGGGHGNACGAVLPRSVQTLPDAIAYLRRVLNPQLLEPKALNSLDHLFDDVQV